MRLKCWMNEWQCRPWSDLSLHCLLKPVSQHNYYSDKKFYIDYICIECIGHKPASVAQLDARPTGDQEVAGSTPAEVGNILSWRLIRKYFLRSFSLFRWFKKGSCQFLAQDCAQYWLTA